MNRKERRRAAAYAAKLRAFAATGTTISDVGHMDYLRTCDCEFCRLIRAGVCMSCAALIHAGQIEATLGKTVEGTVCSPACLEGVERWMAEGGWDQR